MKQPPELKAGIYRHYKNHLYMVLGYGHDANIDNRLLVIYVGLQLDEATPGQPRLNARTAEDFFAWVKPDGTPDNDQNRSPEERQKLGFTPRFTYLGPTPPGL